jgi:hypothetical protein
MDPDLMSAFLAGSVVGYVYARSERLVAAFWRRLIVLLRLAPDGR